MPTFNPGGDIKTARGLAFQTPGGSTIYGAAGRAARNIYKAGSWALSHPYLAIGAYVIGDAIVDRLQREIGDLVFGEDSEDSLTDAWKRSRHAYVTQQLDKSFALDPTYTHRNRDRISKNLSRSFERVHPKP